MIAALISPLFQNFAACTTAPNFLGIFKPWYAYLTLVDDPTTGGCSITNFNNSEAVLGVHSPFLLIAMAVLDDLIRLAALIAVGFIIYGGIQYVTSQGSPDSTKKALQTIINALIGLVVAILASSIVAYLGRELG